MALALSPLVTNVALELARVVGLGWALRPSGCPSCAPSLSCPSVTCSSCPACNCGAGSGSNHFGAATLIVVACLVFVAGVFSAPLLAEFRARRKQPEGDSLQQEARAQLRALKDGSR